MQRRSGVYYRSVGKSNRKFRLEVDGKLVAVLFNVLNCDAHCP
jgi:hypothetical protein